MAIGWVAGTVVVVDDVAVVEAICGSPPPSAAETPGHAGDDDRPDHGHGGERRE